MGSGKGQNKRVKNISIGSFASSATPVGIVETRFNPNEIELLDKIVTDDNYSSREDALLNITLSQLEKLKNGKPIAETKKKKLRNLIFETSVNLNGTTIIQLEDNLSIEDWEKIKEYQELTGSRTTFAAPRYALFEELKDRGLINSDVETPREFTN